MTILKKYAIIYLYGGTYMKKNNEQLFAILEDSAANGITPDLYQYYKGLANNRVILAGEIMDDIVENVAIPLLDMIKEKEDTREKILKEYPLKLDPIEIIIHSPGGSVYDSMFLANIIDKATVPIKVKILGNALSMGMIIAMAGYNNPNVTKECYGFSIGLIHAGSLKMEGEANVVRDTMEFNDKYSEMMKQYVLSHSKITEEEYEAHNSKQWYLTADEMLNYGIVDKVIE